MKLDMGKRLNANKVGHVGCHFNQEHAVLNMMAIVKLSTSALLLLQLVNYTSDENANISVLNDQTLVKFHRLLEEA